MAKVIAFLTQKSLNSAESEIEHRTEQVKFEVNQRLLAEDSSMRHSNIDALIERKST